MGLGEGRVLVVGGGVVGLACAYYLRRAGFGVVVVDGGRVGGGCSHGNCGLVCPSHVLPLAGPGVVRWGLVSLLCPGASFWVRPRLSWSLWRWLWEFGRRCRGDVMLEGAVHLRGMLDSSMAEYGRLVGEEGLVCEWEERGLLYVFRSVGGLEGMGRTDGLLRREFGLGARLVEGVDLPGFDGALRGDLAGGFFYEGDAHLRPEVLCGSWAGRLEEMGVGFVEGCVVEAVRRVGDGVVAVQSSLGELRADWFVFALGAWSGGLGRELGCLVPVEPGKGYSLTMGRPSVCPLCPMLFAEDRVAVTPFGSGYRLGSMMEFVGFDGRVPRRRMEQLRRVAARYLVEPFSGDVREEWCGWRPMTWDSLPIVGRVPGLRNGFLATGHGMLGLSLAPGTGRLLGELMTGQRPHLEARAFCPSRFGG